MKTGRTDSLQELHYLTISPTDEKWGFIVTTAGFQSIPPQSSYPPSAHPVSYRFSPQKGRILNEYQLVYITKGEGYFSSRSLQRQRIKAGTIIFLFPGEWHSYYPESVTGWDEYWLGFKGTDVDRLVGNSFFGPEKPLYNLGISLHIAGLYDDILQTASQEKRGCQQMLAGITQHLLATVYYKEQNNAFADPAIVGKINEAKLIMKDMKNLHLHVEQIAQEIGVGYSLFRKMFKKYTGISPAQYQLQQRLFKAKELLTTTELNITEIAYMLNFECSSQFSNFFHRYEGLSPTEFREQTR